ncbi:MAG: flagellar biosynthetic protein FliO, partial [Bauldia sp.]|nr:flagellar biosynthetic protein FliO [Bauldia sp.]
MDVLSPIIGESAAEVVLVALALLLVAALIVVIAWVLQRFGGRRFGLLGSRSRAPRLGVVDAMPIDSRRRLVLVRRDNVEHLLLIGGGADLVIEQAIQRSVTAAQRGRQAQPPAGREALPVAQQPPTGPPQARHGTPADQP